MKKLEKTKRQMIKKKCNNERTIMRYIIIYRLQCMNYDNDNYNQQVKTVLLNIKFVAKVFEHK